MSAEILRRAVALMRERAEAADGGGRWVALGTSIAEEAGTCNGGACGLGYGHEPYCGLDGPVADASEVVASHIASWHPAVALAVADWLDRCAQFSERGLLGVIHERNALTVARAYLGEQS